jgi:hypothetical protein
VRVVGPGEFPTFPCPTYPEIRLAWRPQRRLAEMIAAERPDAVHVSTEGPLGLAARAACLRAGRRFTTAYHTQFPEYVHARTRLPLALSYRWMRWFHAPSAAVMAATAALRRTLVANGFERVVPWSRGVDLGLFRPGPAEPLPGPRPVFMYVGRVAVEKNLEAFLSLDLPGTKWVVGDGPARADLERRFPNARFAGLRTGESLARHYRAADAFVFPSRTDTFGLVLLEALACGVPVAAYPVTGPVDVVADPAVGVLDEDLRAAALAALRLDRRAAREYATRFSWSVSSRQFLSHLQRVNDLA